MLFNGTEFGNLLHRNEDNTNRIGGPTFGFLSISKVLQDKSL